MVAPPVEVAGVMAVAVDDELREPGRLVVLADEREAFRLDVWVDGVILMTLMVRAQFGCRSMG